MFTSFWEYLHGRRINTLYKVPKFRVWDAAVEAFPPGFGGVEEVK